MLKISTVLMDAIRGASVEEPAAVRGITADLAATIQAELG